MTGGPRPSAVRAALRERPGLVVAALVALALLGGWLTSSEGSTPQDRPLLATAAPSVGPISPDRSSPTVGSPAGSVFGETSVFRRSVRNSPVADGSPGMVTDLVRQVAERYNGVAALNVDGYTAAFYTATASTPRVDIQFEDCQAKGRTPAVLSDPAAGAPFRQVPLPEEAQPAPGTDGQLSVWSPSTDQLWEFWRAHREGRTWYACWGGRIDRVSVSSGRFPPPTGSTATGLAATGLMVGVAEARAGRIDHAIGLALPEPAARYLPPARRGDGTSLRPTAIPEGARLRLDAAVQVDDLGLHPLAAMIARAAQEYGFIVRDRAGAVAVQGESPLPYVEDEGRNPWYALLGGERPYRVLHDFPWDRLQVVAPLPGD